MQRACVGRSEHHGRGERLRSRLDSELRCHDGQVDVHNLGNHPNPSASTINAQYVLVEIVFPGQITGSVTCAITSVSSAPAGSTLSTDKSRWSLTETF